MFMTSVCWAQVTAEVREGTVLLFASEPIEAAGLDFQSPAGRLIPVPELPSVSPSASPFNFFLSNTSNQITWGNLGSTVTIDGAFNTRAGYIGDPAGDLLTFWGDGPTPTNIPVSLSSELIPPNIGPPAQPTTTPPAPDPPVQLPRPEIPPSPTDAVVFGQVREGKVLLFSNEPVGMAGLDLVSPAGNLIPIDGTDASPFTFFLANFSTRITWGNLGSNTTLDGVLNTNAGYIGDPTGDLHGSWGDGATPVDIPFSLSSEPIPEGFESPIVPPPSTPDPPVVNPPVNPPVVTPPSVDGVVTGEIRDGKIVVIASEPVQASGLDFQSAAGLLVPVPDPPGANPFTFFLANTPNQITWTTFGSTVTLDGELVTEAGYTGDPTSGDLRTFWGNGPTPVEFTTTGEGVDLPTVDPPVVTPPVAVDRVSGELRDGKIVVISSEPVRASGLDFQSAAGLLVPVPDPPGANPFTFFFSNTPNQITWANDGTSVTIDGEFVTEAGYVGDLASGDLRTFWRDGPTPVEFTVSESPPPVVDPVVPVNPPLVPSSPSIVSGFVNEDGFIVLLATEPIDAAGLDFQSADGNLVPVSDEVGAEPFTFFLSNTSNQVTWGNLGSTVAIEEFVTGVQYVGDPDGDLVAFWGDGPTPVSIAINLTGPGDELIPEPTGAVLAWFAMLGLLGLRNPRRIGESNG